jgi:hypothetical protein
MRYLLTDIVSLNNLLHETESFEKLIQRNLWSWLPLQVGHLPYLTAFLQQPRVCCKNDDNDDGDNDIVSGEYGTQPSTTMMICCVSPLIILQATKLNSGMTFLAWQ